MKKALSFILALVLLIGLMPVQVFASSTEYTHAIPESQGVANAIARAYQLTDVEWTPKADMPGVNKINGEYTVITYKAGETYKGIPYSGVIATDTYLGLNVSLESFLTALENTNSVLYTENLHSTNPKSATYFGTVCSKFAQYVLDIPGSYNTNNVANIPGVDTIAMPGKYMVDQIKLGDIILHTQNHTAVCTDILYDADGNVAFVEISEAVFPQVRRKLWSPEAFYEHFSGYRLCRYQHIDEVSAVPSGVSNDLEYALMPRFGDKYNYKVSSTKGIVDILESGYSTAVVIRDGKVIDRIVVDSTTKTFKFDCSVPGHIEMYLEKADGTRSGSVYANVVKSSVSVNDSSEFARGKLTVTIDGSCGAPLYVQVGSAHAIFCNVEGREGTVEITFPASKISTRQVRVAYQNEYGIYLSKWVSFTADENPSKDPLLSQGQYWNGYNITPSSPNPVVQEDKAGYWSYTMIPVEENTTYYSLGATRLWYLDAGGEGISTYNAYKDSTVPCQFTTPEGTAYVSIAYSPNLLNQGEEKIEKLSADSEDGNDEEEIVPSNPSTDPYLSQGTYWDGYNLTPSSHLPQIQEGREAYWTYTMIPVEENTTYYSWGATRMWYLDANGRTISTYNAYKDSAVPCQFTTPEGTAYVSIAYSPNLLNQGEEKIEKLSADSEDGNDEEEIVPSNPSTDPYLSQGEYWDGYTLTPSKSTPTIQSGKEDYWTYTMVQVEGNTMYYSVGANRMWFFDANKKPISTYNAISDSTIRFQFTTPENARYVSITYAPSVVEKGTETMKKVGPVITQQAASVQQEIGKKFAITVKAEGEGLTYQWYYKNAGMKNFGVSSNKTSSYAYTMQSYMHNRQVYCVITDAYGNSVQTEIATITRPPQALKIIEQPQDARVNVGEKFSISPKVDGEGLTYQWYVKEAGAKAFKVSSNKTSAYAYTMQNYMIGRQVYCVITDQYGNSVTTDVATISLPPVELKILEQPSDVYAVKGEKFSISFVVQGDGMTYQWYYKESYMKDFKPSSNKTSAYAYSMQNYMDGRSVYCVITDQYGNQVITEAVTIHLEK